MKTKRKGQVLPIVMGCLVVLVIIIAAMVKWLQNDTQWTVKSQRTTSAINLAQAGEDRAQWKLQSSTTTWTAAAAGNIASVTSGYNFDITYTDIPGGTYRIKITSGPTSGGSCTVAANCVTVLSEGRDSSTNEVRAVSTVYVNQTIYSALMAGGNVSWSPGLGLFWGPIISQGNITLENGIDAWYFPQKYAKGVVLGTAANPRDTNGLVPPNTDNVEWWSNYAGVPSLPQLDFASLRSSAAATGTLNIYGCQGSSSHGQDLTGTGQGSTPGAAPWDANSTCNPAPGPHNNHFGDSTNFVKTVLLDTTFSNNYVWYWDGDVTLTGQFNSSNQPYSPGRSTSLRGTIIVRGNLTIASPGDFIYSGHVPANAWMQEQKLLTATYDTAAANQYPADTGLHQNAATFGFGYTFPTFNVPLPPNSSSPNEYATVGMRGLVYVGKNLTILSYMDINGALWVNGNVTASGGSYTQFCSIFYDDTLLVPAFNVILLRQSWQETAPSTTAWH